MPSATLPLHAAAWTLTFLLHGALLVGATWLLTRRMTSHRLRERLWKTAFAGAFVTATLSILAGSAGLTPGLTRGWALRTVEALSPAPSRTSALAAPALGAVDAQLGPAQLDSALVGSSQLGSNALGSSPLAPAPGRAGRTPTAARPATLDPTRSRARVPEPLDAAVRPATPLPWAALLAGLWVLGAGTALVRLGLTWRRFGRRLRDRRRVVDGRAATLLAELSERSGVRDVRLSSSAALASPITFGVLRREICIPERALAVVDGLRDEELRALLAHELAHVARHDPAWLTFCAIVERVFFFQPLLGLARRRWRDDAELCCDDWAVEHTGERLSLAACLTEVAGWIVREPRGVPVLGMATAGAGLGRRVRRLLEAAPELEPRRSWLRPASLLVLGGVALAAPRVEAIRQDASVAEASPATPALRPGAQSPGVDPLSKPTSERRSKPESEPVSESVVAPVSMPATEPVARRVSEPTPETIIGARVGAPDAALPAPLPLGFEGELVALDRELELLASEARALRDELASDAYPSAWRDASGRLVDSIVQRVGRLRAQRTQLDRLLGAPSIPAPAGDSSAPTPGPRSGPQPSR